jgi:hypothetical protein
MSQQVNELNQCLGEPVSTGDRFLTGASNTGKSMIFRPTCENAVAAFATVAFGFGSSLA